LLAARLELPTFLCVEDGLPFRCLEGSDGLAAVDVSVVIEALEEGFAMGVAPELGGTIVG